MGVLSTGSKKDQLKKASSTYLGTFRRIVKGLTETNKQITAEEAATEKSIKNLQQDLVEYGEIKKENQGVIDGLNQLLGINKSNSN